MEVVSNSRANPVNRIMGRAQFDFLPPNIVNPKMLEGIVQERTISLPKSQILGSIGVWYSLHVHTKGPVERGRTCQFRYCDLQRLKLALMFSKKKLIKVLEG